jgi:hypothetical protein
MPAAILRSLAIFPYTVRPKYSSKKEDTLRGIRGEIQVQVKIQFFGDSNPLQNSSNDILFFSSPTLACLPYNVQVLGLVHSIEIEG